MRYTDLAPTSGTLYLIKNKYDAAWTAAAESDPLSAADPGLFRGNRARKPTAHLKARVKLLRAEFTVAPAGRPEALEIIGRETMLSANRRHLAFYKRFRKQTKQTNLAKV
jgi:hypothetical protein